jgi:hypothetical protein
MEASQQQEEQSFNDERAVIASELHTIVDNLQPETEPQVESPRRPFWQRAVVWQVPLFLIALAAILMYNPRVDNCNGFKITYKKQLLCISNDADFFLFVEHFTCDFIEKGKSAADSLEVDALAQPKLNAYYEKHKFSLEIQPVEAEVLRGMRGVYDSASFCKNLSKAYWNVGIRLLNNGQKDSACYYFNKIEAWSWGDSVLTAADKRVISNNCNDALLEYQIAQQADIAQRAKQDSATALNAVNDKLLNFNRVLQNRVNQRDNKNKVVLNNNVPLQQSLPVETSKKTYIYYTNGTSERDKSKLVKLEDLEEIIVINNIYDTVNVLFTLKNAAGAKLWKIKSLTKLAIDSTISIKIDKALLNKYLSSNRRLYLDEEVSGSRILSRELMRVQSAK